LWRCRDPLNLRYIFELWLRMQLGNCISILMLLDCGAYCSRPMYGEEGTIVMIKPRIYGMSPVERIRLRS
jgi:hypothetical protein